MTTWQGRSPWLRSRPARTFASQGRLDGPAGKATTGLVDDDFFGPGKRIVVRHAARDFSSLEIYRSLPFVLIRRHLHNGGQKEIDVPKVVPATWAVELGKPAGELRTLGTAGLTAPDKNPGSYLFLTVADPATRRGVVAGWLSNDRGSGVVFSGVKQGKVEFRAQIDYGRLPIPPGQVGRAGDVGRRRFRRCPDRRRAICRRPGQAAPYQAPSASRRLLQLVFRERAATRSRSSSWRSLRRGNCGRSVSPSCRSITIGKTAASTTARGATSSAQPQRPLPARHEGPAEAIRQLGLTAGHLVHALRLQLPGSGIQGPPALVREASQRQALRH